MQILKQYTIEKGSTIAATAQFWSEISDLKLSTQEKQNLMREFIDAYRRSEDYDLASQRIFDRLMPSLSRKSAFSKFWPILTGSVRNLKGKDVVFNTVVYRVTDQQNGQDDQNRYKLLRYDTFDGKVKATIITVLAKDEEMEVIT